MNDKKLHRDTFQKRIILEELRKLTSHPTAADLYQTVRLRLPRISLGTVYRNLNSMVEQGLIQKLEFSGRESRFDGNVSQHYHIRCMNCGRVEDLLNSYTPVSAEEIKEHGGWRILRHRLELIGICPECREEDERPA